MFFSANDLPLIVSPPPKREEPLPILKEEDWNKKKS